MYRPQGSQEVMLLPDNESFMHGYELCVIRMFDEIGDFK